MSWYAECKRRHWYCILEWDAISWYSNYLYDQWYASLTKEQKEKLKQYKEQKKKKDQQELNALFQRLGLMFATFANTPYINKYHGLYNSHGNVNPEYFKN